MDSYTLIRKVKTKCPLCDETHELEERICTTPITIKNENVSYEERFYFCPNASANFANGKMLRQNLANAREAYRKRKELLAIVS